MILYRADAHRSMELNRNLALESVTIFLQKFCKAKLAATLKARALKLRPVCANALATKNLEKCEMALSMASKVGFEIYEIKALKKLKNDFYEQKRLNQEFEALVYMDAYECYDMFQDAVKQADGCDLHSPIAQQVRQMFYEAQAYRQALDKDAEDCMVTLDKPVMLNVVERADAINYSTAQINEIRDLLYNTSEDAFVKKQLKAAVKLNDRERTVRREIKLKNMVLDKQGGMFEFKKYNQLEDPKGWADLKFLCFNKDALAQGFLKHSKDAIHSSLQDLSTQIASDGKTKMKSLALKIFKNILGYMGDKKCQYPDQLAIEILNWGLANPVLRDEAFLQLMKQLSNNPDVDSRKRGWQMMQIFIDTIKPQQQLENYVEMFLRSNAQPANKFLNMFHQTNYGGARTQPPAPDEIQQILSWSSPLRLGFDPSIEMQVQTAGSQLPGPVSRTMAGGKPPMGGPPMGGPPMGGPPMGGPPRGGPPRAAPAPQLPPIPDYPWYYCDLAGNQCGPSEPADVRKEWKAGKINEKCIAWCEIMSDWEDIGALPELFAYCKF